MPFALLLFRVSLRFRQFKSNVRAHISGEPGIRLQPGKLHNSPQNLEKSFMK